MTKAEKTKEYIVEKTADLFNKKGYAATSLSDITEATGLTKGSIYGNFENKEQVAKAVYLYNSNRLSQGICDIINSKTTTLEKLSTFLNYYRDNWETIRLRGGCPLLNSAVEADDTMPFLREEVHKSFTNWAQLIIDILEAGKINKEINNNINSDEYAYLFIMLIEGGILLSKTTRESKHLYHALEKINNIIDTEIVL